MALDPTASSFTPTADPSTSTPSAPDTTTSSSNDNTPLFPPTLLPPSVLAALPTGYTIRPLYRSDYHLSFLDVLRVLTSVGDISEPQWNERYDWMAARDEYYILVVLDGSGRIVGTGALVVERKFIHNLGMVGHVEDIAVARDQQGMKLGLRIMEALRGVGERVGCYKVCCYVSFGGVGVLGQGGLVGWGTRGQDGIRMRMRMRITTRCRRVYQWTGRER